MPQESVEIVRENFDSWNEGRIDDFRDLFDPDVAITRFIDEWPEPGPVVGRDAVMAFYEGLRPWDDTTAEPIGEFLESGDRVAVRIRWRASAQGQEVSMDVTAVYTLRSSRISAVEFFRDHAEALEAVGLSEQAMSPDNAEIVRAMLTAFTRRDHDAFAALFAPEAEIVPIRAELEGTVYAGEDAPAQFLAGVDEMWREPVLELTEVRDLGDVILGTGVFRALGRESGVRVETPFWLVTHFRDGLVTRARTTTSHAAALEAAGLSE
jgi:ketosteroid isomerase-like protein